MSAGARFVIFGGGCYGTFYARQLVRAAQTGIAVDEIVVVDRNKHPPVRAAVDSPLVHVVQQNWDDFCDVYFGQLATTNSDRIVPPPFTPHLALSWLLRRLTQDRLDLNWSLEPIKRMPGTPYQNQSVGGPVTLSHADWICPVNCIEPERCPKTRETRYWDLATTVQQWSHAFDDVGQAITQTHLFQCLHYTHGVGTYPAAQVVQARDAMADVTVAADRPARFLVGTVSRCHGAIHLLKAEAGTDTVSETASSFPLE
jgi:hypothetical protein